MVREEKTSHDVEECLVNNFLFYLQKIGCRLKIFSNIAPQSTDRVAQVIGKEEQCVESLLEIIDLIKGTPIKGPIHNYDPHNFDDMYADEYGGYGSGMNAANPRSNSGGRNNDRR